MQLKELKTQAICLVSAIALMSVVYSLYFVINSEFFSWNLTSSKFLNYIESLSWSLIYFIIGTIILCFECLFYKTNQKGYAISIGLSILLLLLFTIICIAANNTLFNLNAVIFSIGLFFISAMITLSKITQQDRISIISCAAGVVAIIITISICNRPYEMNIEINKVAQKYEAEFKGLGYTKVISDETRNLTEYYFNIESEREEFKIDSPLVWIMRVPLESNNKLNMDLLISTYKNNGFVDNADGVLSVEEYKYETLVPHFLSIKLYIKNNKLYIDNISVDKNKTTQQELAKKLDLVMKYIIMPRLKEIKRQEEDKVMISNTYQK